MKPQRIQRKRSKGFKLESPNGLPIVYVGRPTKWGNPFPATPEQSAEEVTKLYKKLLSMSQTKIVKQCGHPFYGLHIIMWRNKVRQHLPELRGKNLACWCRLDQSCHADILLRIAND